MLSVVVFYNNDRDMSCCSAGDFIQPSWFTGNTNGHLTSYKMWLYISETKSLLLCISTPFGEIMLHGIRDVILHLVCNTTKQQEREFRCCLLPPDVQFESIHLLFGTKGKPCQATMVLARTELPCCWCIRPYHTFLKCFTVCNHRPWWLSGWLCI